MTNRHNHPAVAYLRNKLAAAGEEAHEALESPEQEALEHQQGAGEGNEAHAEGGIEQLLAQLSPEEVEQLAAELSGDIQHPDDAHGDVAGLAKAISSHLQQSPEASVPVSDPEKQAAFEFVKSASYIHGFINQAVHDGVAVKTAVDLYDSSLALTIENLKMAEIQGRQEYKQSNQTSTMNKTAAYYAGMLERAREYGIPEHVAVQTIKQASLEEQALQLAAPLGNLGDLGAGTGNPFSIPERIESMKALLNPGSALANLGETDDLGATARQVMDNPSLAQKAREGLENFKSMHAGANPDLLGKAFNYAGGKKDQLMEALRSAGRYASDHKDQIQAGLGGAGAGALAGGGAIALHNYLKNKKREQQGEA